MIEMADGLWAGDSDDEQEVAKGDGVVAFDSVLCVAQDMDGHTRWSRGVEYAQVGLIDGPGNPLAAYHAAVLTLAVLLRRGTTLVCCHDGGRSLAVVITYLYLVGEGPSWDEAIERAAAKARTAEPGTLLPVVHEAHKHAFYLMDWTMLERVLEEEV